MALPFYQKETVKAVQTSQPNTKPATAETRKPVGEYHQKLVLYEKGKLTSDPQIQNLVHRFNKTSDKELIIPHTGMAWQLYKQTYERVPIVANSVNNTANFALQAGFELDASDDANKKIERFFDKHNFRLTLLNIFKQMQIYGNAYLEVSNTRNIKLLPPETMFVVVQKGGTNDGQVRGYKQILQSNITKPIDFKKTDIIHYKWNDATNMFYGMSDIRPVLGTLTRYLNWTDDLGQILHRFAAPFLHHKVGTEQFPGTQTQIDDYASTVQNRTSGEDIISSSAIEIEAVGAKQKMVQPDALVRSLENEIIAGLQIPALFLRGGETTNKATADVELQVFDRKVKGLQRVVGTLNEDFLFPKITSGKAKMIWNEFSAEGELTRAQRVQLLVVSGVRIDVALDMVGLGTWKNDVKKAAEEMKKEQELMMQKAAQQKQDLRNPSDQPQKDKEE